MKSSLFLSSVLCVAIIASCSNPPQPAAISGYPVSARVDTVDNYFGEQVPDPYRWMENDTARATTDWVKSQNEVTFGFLKTIPYRDAIRKRLDKVVNYERISAPTKYGEYYYYSRNSGLQNHNVQYRKKGENGAEELFMDPNTFSADGTTALAGMFFSKDGSMLTILIQEGGSDWRKAVTMKAQDKSIIGDTLHDLKFTGIAWKGNDGFYYSRYDNPRGNKLFSKVNFNKVCFHKLNTLQSGDKVIFDGSAYNPQRRAGANLTEDERYLIIAASISTTGNELYLQDLANPKGEIIPVVTNFDNNHNVIDSDGSRLIIQTNLNAPNDRIIEVDFSKPTPDSWKDLISESTEPIQNVNTAGRKLFVSYLKDVKYQVKQFDNKGKEEREVQLSGIGTANGFGGWQEDTDVYYSFTSFTSPPTIYKYNLASGKSTEYARPKVDFNPDDYETRQVFYESKDGTKVPMFIVHKKGIELNGKNPTLLYAYGGFNISLTPGFSASRVVWLENGGIYAQPNLRGGGEYGEKWHLAGTKMNKQNVFDDFIAAAEYLIKEKYTSSDLLAIQGGSNGGLLVGATMTQRPELMKVALPGVGVMDMLRYHKFTVGKAWAFDYGTSEDSKEMFEYLKKYSPVHALKAGTAYPATMVTTADHDDRVVPAHSFKFAATLQESHNGNAPVLIRIDTKSGHGSSNLSKALDSTADQFAFTWYNMGVIPPLARKDM